MKNENGKGRPNKGQFTGQPGPGRPKGSKAKVPNPPKQLRDLRYVYRTEKAGGEHE